MKKGNPLFIVLGTFFILIAGAIVFALVWGLSGHAFQFFNWEWRGGNMFQSGNTVLMLEESYALDDINDLSVNMVSEDIRVTFTGAQEMTLRYYGLDSEENVKVEQTGHRLQFTSPLKNRIGISFGFTGDLRCEIELPYTYAETLSLGSISGDVVMGDGAGQYQALHMSTTSGDIRMDSDITAQSAAFSSISGNIKGSRLMCGETSASTTSGDIRFSDWEGAGTVSSISGSVNVALLRLTGDLSVGTTSGDVKLTLTPDAVFTLKANSVSGDINTNFQTSYEGRHKNNAKATVGSGVNRLDISTISGEIDVYLS